MLIDICSDLHLLHYCGHKLDKDFVLELLKPKSDILIIAGDLCEFGELEPFLKVFRKCYHNVIMVAGNHDHYGASVSTVTKWIKDFNRFKKIQGVTILENGDRIILDGVRFIGACGWYDFKCNTDKGISEKVAYKAWYANMNDRRYVVFDTGAPDVLAEQHAKNIRNELASNTEIPTVIITHTIPHRDLAYWHNTSMDWNYHTPSFVNTYMESVNAPNLKCWIFGHTHTRMVKTLNGVDYWINALGYPREPSNNWETVQVEV